MGYDLHITRKEHWADEDGPAITLAEWRGYVDADPEMRLDGHARIDTAQGALRVDDPGIAVWTAWSGHGAHGNMVWFSHDGDGISVKNPDEEIIGKMHRIATALGAKLQGDDGEVYGADGNSNWEELRAPARGAHRPWWKLW